ncbi:MAG TPA: acyl-CoA dehydrogenase family protein [Microthrixaceae bacterium]|nr:acyl-CoA dehydrogenase family protein [Microthrixaceae bacterium]
MDFEWDAETQRFREEVRRFLDLHLTPELEDQLYEEGLTHDEGFAAALGERNWIAGEWAREGFEALDGEAMQVLEEEFARTEAPYYAVSTSMMVAKVIRAVGSEWLNSEIVPKVVTGEVAIALGMSEPEAGSDVAAVQTRAREVEGGWVIDGQKMFTTNANICEFVFLLARTDPDSVRHRGLTTFLVPVASDGFEAQAVVTVSGERTNITYYSDLVLEDRWRISEVGAGWQSLMMALQDEHSAPFCAHLGRALDAAEQWGADPGPDGTAPIERADVRQRLVKVATDLEVARLLERRTSWMETVGEVPVAEGPMSKLFSTEAIVRGSEELTALVGPDALRSRSDPSAVHGGRIEHLLRFSLGTTIYAGTSEVQRNIIAQRRCGLPR